MLTKELGMRVGCGGICAGGEGRWEWWVKVGVCTKEYVNWDEEA